MKGAEAARMSPTRFAPYRKIVGHERNEHGSAVEVLECGHRLRPRHDMIGETYPMRRRCVDCLNVTCAADGHPLVDWYGPDNWLNATFMRCRCTERDESGSTR
jgi:hypothetical protein